MHKKLRSPLGVMLCLSLVAAGLAGGCTGKPERIARPRSTTTNVSETQSVPQMLRGTIMAQALLDGYRDDVIVAGYGFVVGLNGTGNRILPDTIRSHMLAEMSRRGVGQRSQGGSPATSPERLLDSSDTAVVVVKAVLPPGAPTGTDFDVRVEALDGTGTTSLEGGVLWTTELRPHTGIGLPAVGSRQARALAEARGPIFTNPFIVSGDSQTDVISTVGRVLGGGKTIRDMPLKLRLLSPSHARASSLQQVINSYFPQEPGQRRKTAWGEGDESIEITIPPSWHDRTAEFAQVLLHTPMFTTQTELRYISRVLKENPGDSQHASWRWQAIGPDAIPALREFYAYPEEKPRFAALRAGARLRDPQVEPHLLRMANDSNASLTVRRDAIALLGDMEAQPQNVLGLRALLNDEEIEVRIAAYEALDKLRTLFVRTYAVDDQKYRIDFVESDYPLVYVTLAAEPRIVVFGSDLEFPRPMSFATWAGRFIMKSEPTAKKMEVAFRDTTGFVSQYTIGDTLDEFLPFLGHTTTIERPAVGLGLSYNQVVGLLAAMDEAKMLPAPFRTEQDRIQLAILEQAAETPATEERPELRDETTETPTAPDANIPSNLLDEHEALRPLRRETADDEKSDGSDG